MEKEIKVFKALSDDNRLKILDHISTKKETKSCCEGACVKDLAEYLGVSMATVSHHIKELVNAGLIETRKDGKWVYCCVNKEAIKEINTFLKTILENKKVAQ
jgi:DNA-binding transcriptional ArsR family regulator